MFYLKKEQKLNQITDFVPTVSFTYSLQLDIIQILYLLRHISYSLKYLVPS